MNGALRPFPYPFRGGIAIANDIDNARFEDFSSLHEYLNTSRATHWGKGLELEIGDSFWLYSNGSQGADAFTYCCGLTDDRTPHADTIDALIDAGYLDSLHSWGNFSEHGGFTREFARRGAALLRRHEGRVPVWINHGDPANEQMAGRNGWDDAASRHGHADCVAAAGMRYLWTGSITSSIGRARAPRDTYLRPLVQFARRAPLGNRFYGKRLLRPLDTRAGRFATFIRFGVWDRATRDDLDFLLSDRNLRDLAELQTAAIVYVHLFQRRDAAAPDQTAAAFSRLAEYSRRGDLLVTTTSRLLNYLVIRDHGRWDVATTGGRTVISYTGLAADAPSRWPVARTDLRGATFYVDAPETAVVRFLGQDVDALRINPPDESGRPSVSVAWDALKYPL